MILHRIPLPLAAAAVIVLVALTGCSSGGSSARPPTTAPTVAATTTTAMPTTTVYQPSSPQKTQDAAAAHLVAAWKAGDRVSALTDATPAAVDSTFAQPYPAGGVQFRSCSNAVAGPSFCDYRIFATGALLELSVSMTPGGWEISAAQFES